MWSYETPGVAHDLEIAVSDLFVIFGKSVFFIFCRICRFSSLVFTDLQRRTLIAIFKENKRPSKEMQLTISQQLGLELSTVSNFFMNARRRCVDRWHEEHHHGHVASPGQPGTSATTFSKA